MAGYTVNITEVSPVVTATSTINNITITSDNNPTITVAETSFNFTATTVVNTVTLYTDAIELLVDDFANYFRGDWISGTTYRRGELVNDRYSLFVCSTGTLTTVTSTINPSDYRDTLSWTRVVWNEAPRDHLTVTNYLTVGTIATLGSLEVSGDSHLNGTGTYVNGTLEVIDGAVIFNGINVTGNAVLNNNLNVNGSATLSGNNSLSTTTFTKSVSIDENLNVAGIATSGNLVVNNSATISGSLNVGDITGNGGVSIAGPLRVNGISTFSNYVTFDGTATFNNDVVLAKDLTVPNLTVTNTLKASGVLYPVNTGSYGQVIANMGDYTAEWRNLGDLNFWSLNDDLKTNGFNLITGIAGDGSAPELRIVRGTDESSAYDHSSLNFYGELDGLSGGSVELYGRESLALTAGTRFTPYGSNEHRPHIILDPASGTDGTVFIRADTLSLSGGTAINGASSLSVNTIYGNGGYINIANPGFEFSDGTRLNTALPDISGVLPIASSSILGGIKIGDRLTINPITGVLSADIQSNPYTLPTASATTLGGIKVGGGLTISAGVLSVINTGTGYFSTSTVSLGSTMFTNGYPIRWAEDSQSYLDINQNTVILQATEARNSKILLNEYDYTRGLTDAYRGVQLIGDSGNIYTNSTSTNVTNDATVIIAAPTIKVGYQSTGNVQIGELRVNKIYNYAGTYAPFFPAGIQYADNTVQVTAYHPDGGPLPAV
jgi:cytoskeletal protein CcmA (bactofilin family)